MTKLKLGPLADDRMNSARGGRSRKLVGGLKLRAGVHRDLIAYAEALGRASGQAAPDPTKLIVPMIERFMATDRAFAKTRRSGAVQTAGAPEKSG